MHSLSDKLLPILLALLLGFSPLQGAVASMSSSPYQNMNMQQVMDHEDGRGVSPHQQCPHCQKHMSDNCSLMHAGSANHCTGCIVGILPATTSLLTPTLRPLLRTHEHQFTSQVTASLYRPPRG